MSTETKRPKYREHDIVRVGSEYIEEQARGLEGHIFGGVVRDQHGNFRYSIWVPDLGENWCIPEQDLECTGHMDDREGLYKETRVRSTVDLEAAEGIPS